jgi:hypothetical protein
VGAAVGVAHGVAAGDQYGQQAGRQAGIAHHVGDWGADAGAVHDNQRPLRAELLQPLRQLVVAREEGCFRPAVGRTSSSVKAAWNNSASRDSAFTDEEVLPAVP